MSGNGTLYVVRNVLVSFHMYDAMKIGLYEAVLMQILRRKLVRNKLVGSCFFDGKYWADVSLKKVARDFPFFSESSLKDLVESLVNRKVLLKRKTIGCQEKREKDSEWYTFYHWIDILSEVEAQTLAEKHSVIELEL